MTLRHDNFIRLLIEANNPQVKDLSRVEEADFSSFGRRLPFVRLLLNKVPGDRSSERPSLHEVRNHILSPARNQSR